MTHGERWRVAFVLALALHFFILQPDWGVREKSTAASHAVLMNLSPGTVRGGNQPGATMQLGQLKADEASTIADKRRKAYNRFIAEVAEEVHRRRFDSGRQDLIGVATFSFIVRVDGSFAELTLVNTSGKPLLDAAAENAIRAASGKIRRPAELGNESISIIILVKYQYALR